MYVERKESTNTVYVLFEVWKSQESLLKHYLSLHYREHAKALVDYLLVPESVQSMNLPGAWFMNEAPEAGKDDIE